MAILDLMHLIAVVSADADIRHALRSFRDGQGRFHLHPVPPGGVEELYRALRRLDFAGALVLDPGAQPDALRLAERSSLDAEDVGGADTATVTPGGVIAEYNLGRAAGALLASARWDARGADVVLLGGAQAARGLARELSSQGAASIAMLGPSPSDAEQTLPKLPAGTRVVARAANDPLVPTLLEQADLLVRLDSAVRVPAELLGPHLTLLEIGRAHV